MIRISSCFLLLTLSLSAVTQVRFSKAYLAGEGGLAMPVNSAAKDVYNAGYRLKLTGGYSLFQWSQVHLGVSLKGSLGRHESARGQATQSELQLYTLAAGPYLAYDVSSVPPLVLLLRPYIGLAIVEQTLGAVQTSSNEMIFISTAEMRYLVTNTLFIYGWASFGQVQLSTPLNTLGLGGGLGVQF